MDATADKAVVPALAVSDGDSSGPHPVMLHFSCEVLNNFESVPPDAGRASATNVYVVVLAPGGVELGRTELRRDQQVGTVFRKALPVNYHHHRLSLSSGDQQPLRIEVRRDDGPGKPPGLVGATDTSMGSLMGGTWPPTEGLRNLPLLLGEQPGLEARGAAIRRSLYHRRSLAAGSKLRWP